MGRTRRHSSYVTTGGGSPLPSVRDYTSVVSASGGTVALPWPNTTVEVAGTPAFIVQSCRGNETNNLPTGGPTWTLFREFTGGTTSSYRKIATYWAYATGAAEPNVTISCSGNYISACMFTIDDTLTSGNFLELVRSADSGASTACSFASANTAGPNRLVFDLLALTVDSAADPTTIDLTNSTLASYTKYVDSSSTSGSGGSISVSAGGLVNTGAVGETTATLSSSVRHAKVSIAVVPAP